MENGTLALADLPSDIVGIRACADALKVSASTISRQVSAGKIPNRGTRASPKVSIAEARKARAENLDPSQQRAPEPPPLRESPAGFQAHRAAHEKTKAEKAAIELSQMRGELVSRAEMEDFLHTAARAFRDALTRRWRVLAVEFEGQTARDIEAKGLAADEAALQTLADTFENWNANTDVAAA